jgi:MoxR-like ATPase
VFIDPGFSRVQFTPDLLPSDVTGSEIYHEQTGTFDFQPGPIFGNLVLADEINRAPAKVQAALLEAMEERQVTVAGTTHKLPPLFLVLATQNPIEQEGTYPLPEAQMDRFMLKVAGRSYPSAGGGEGRSSIARWPRCCASPKCKVAIAGPSSSPRAARPMEKLYIDDKVKSYVVDRRARDPRAQAPPGIQDLDGAHRGRRLTAGEHLPGAHGAAQGECLPRRAWTYATPHDVKAHRPRCPAPSHRSSPTRRRRRSSEERGRGERRCSPACPVP